MIKNYILPFLIGQLIAIASYGQVKENFDDSDYTNNPGWVGKASDWIVNANLQLQSNSATASNSFYLSTDNHLATMVQWEFYIHLGFNTSSANYVDVFLTASASDLTLAATTGYFIRIGNTQDEVSLYRKDAGGTITKIIDGLDGITNHSDNALKVKVTRGAENEFILYSDVTGTGNNYVSEGTVKDDTYTTSAYFGFLIKQSTSSFFKKHYFDDILIQPYEPDITPPSIKLTTALSPISLDVLFSEPIDTATARNALNYSASNGLGNPTALQSDPGNLSLVHLMFSIPFSNGTIYTLTINGVKDLAGNVLNNGSTEFSYYTPQQYDVVIDEIMADPNPPVNLPDAEFIELKNISGRAIDLSGWKLSTSNKTSGLFPDYRLQADSFVILTSATHAASFISYGSVLSIPGFPAFDNTGTTLSLQSKEGKTIHALQYSKDWYQNPVKETGGWTLEMTDTHNPCNGMSNWKASIDPNGGTPGRKNSTDGINTDQYPPQLIRTYSLDSVTVIALFNEPLDSVSTSILTAYSLDNGIAIVSSSPQAPLFDQVILKLANQLESKKEYLLKVNQVKDCKGNSIGIYNTAKVGLAEEALSPDLIINEILFNPRSGAYDYIEIYNRSNKIVDAGRLYIADRNSTGAISSVKKLKEQPYYIFPGDYMVITENKASLEKEYFVKNPGSVIEISSLPSYPDDKGTVVLANAQGVPVDEVAYSKGWQFALISNPSGVALERIDPAGPSQDKNNWHSAASTSGYGTPGYKNSQYKQQDIFNATIDVAPKVFSPDNDGHDDVSTISYQVGSSGYVANIYLFDANGRMVRYLVKNALLGLKGSWNWDGLDEKGQKLPVGNYIVYSELFTLDGKKRQFKNTVALVRNL